MSRQPTVGGDNNAWGTVLNDYLTQTAIRTALSSSPSAGATTFDVAVVPPGLIVGALVAIDAFTTQCELRSVTAISGNTITVAATKYDHASGDVMLVLTDFTVTPAMYGMTTVTDDNWNAVQRMVLETTDYNCLVHHISALKGNVWRVSQPVCVPSGAQWNDFGLATHSTFSPADSGGALCMVAERHWALSADASTDTFTVSGGHGMSQNSAINHTRIAFNAPYGETLPGGITAGQVYYIKTVPDSTTFTIQADPAEGSATVDITSDGTGYGWEEIQGLSRVYWDNVRFDLSVSDVNGIRVSLQQPGYISNLRLSMNAAATTRAYGLIVEGQIGYITNAEINPSSDNCTGVSLSGTGITFTNLNLVGHGRATATYGLEVGCVAGSITNLWTESIGIGVKLTAESRGFAIYGSWLMSGAGTALQVDSAAEASSYTVCPIKAGTDGDRVLNDVGRNISLYASGYTTDTTLVATDYQGTYMGHVQEGQNYSDVGYKPPILAYRPMISKAADYSLRYIDRGVIVNSSGANRTVTLPTAANWIGHEFVIHHISGSANTCTIDGAGSETIDGSTTTTVASGSSLRIMSNGSDWFSV